MKVYRIFGSVFVLFLLWECAAMMMQNDWLMPYPQDVFLYMKQQVFQASFYQTVSITLFRSLLGLGLSFVLACMCAYVSYCSPRFRDLSYPLLLLTRSVPNISYILFVFIWFGSERSTTIISFLILFPTIYSSMYQGFLHINQDLKNVIRMYPKKQWYLIRRVYIPMLEEAINTSLSNGVSLTFKVGVMSEIIGQVQTGIGRSLNLCRLQNDMTGIFAWTGWIILILLVIEKSIQIIHHFRKAQEI